jgi:hypothetical protein
MAFGRATRRARFSTISSSCTFGWDTGYDMGGYDGAGGGGGGAWPYDNMER